MTLLWHYFFPTCRLLFICFVTSH